MNEYIDDILQLMSRWMDGWMNRYVDGCVDGRKDKWMDRMLDVGNAWLEKLPLLDLGFLMIDRCCCTSPSSIPSAKNFNGVYQWFTEILVLGEVTKTKF